MSLANCSSPDFSPLNRKQKEDIRVRETVQDHRIAPRTKKAACSRMRRKRAQGHRPRSPARYHHASGNRSQYPSHCPPRVPRRRARRHQIEHRHLSRYRYRTRSSLPGRGGWGPTEGCCRARKGYRKTIREGCWVLVRDVMMAPIRGSLSEGYPAQGNWKLEAFREVEG
jgi:hypothetical protein